MNSVSKKIVRSSKCSLKFTNQGKIEKIKVILEEYSKAVNYYIDRLKDWELKEGQFIETSIINSFQHEWMTHRLKKNACREAVGMVILLYRKKCQLYINSSGLYRVALSVGYVLVTFSTLNRLQVNVPTKFSSL